MSGVHRAIIPPRSSNRQDWRRHGTDLALLLDDPIIPPGTVRILSDAGALRAYRKTLYSWSIVTEGVSWTPGWSNRQWSTRRRGRKAESYTSG